MRIRFFTGGTPLESQNQYLEENADITLYCFYENIVSYERELKGEADFFERAARLSKTAGVVVCGAITDTKGVKRKSAVVAEKGRLVGVSDACNGVDGEYACGAQLRVYETAVGRMGVVVDGDLCFPEIFETLSVCGSDFIVCPFGEMNGIESVLLRANAYCYGVPIYFCARGYCMIADVTGEIVYATSQNGGITSFSPRKEYHLVETRRRGFFRGKMQ